MDQFTMINTKSPVCRRTNRSVLDTGILPTGHDADQLSIHRVNRVWKLICSDISLGHGGTSATSQIQGKDERFHRIQQC